jgi:hypothetical protein
MLVAISRAFDLEAVDRLLFLSMCPKDYLVLSGDGLLHFARLIAADLAWVEQKSNNSWELVTYAVNISEKGRQLIHAWKLGDRTMLAQLISGQVVAADSGGEAEPPTATQSRSYIGFRVPALPS